MAVACAVAVANLYYIQPMLGVVGRAFHGGFASSMLFTATQVGYAAGMLFLMPLGDLLVRRDLIGIQFLGLALALVGAALAPDAWTLLGMSFLIGVGASVAQQIVPAAAALAPEERRGAVVGSVMAGLLAGILLSRTLSGWIAAEWGWRTVFWVAAPLALAGAAVTRLFPGGAAAPSMGYAPLMGSLFALWRQEPRLRRCALVMALAFASFSAFWTVLALHLEEAPFFKGSDVAGLFGIVGLVGVCAAPWAGRRADRQGAEKVAVWGAAAILLSWAALGLWNSMLGLAAGVVALDFGEQTALVANQRLVYSLRPEAHNRLNAMFMTVMFLGGSLGSAAAVGAFKAWGWPAVAVFGAATGLAAMLAAFGGASRGEDSQAAQNGVK
jgi:predicted MFS family arabinose efflux permease